MGNESHIVRTVKETNAMCTKVEEHGIAKMPGESGTSECSVPVIPARQWQFEGPTEPCPSVARGPEKQAIPTGEATEAACAFARAVEPENFKHSDQTLRDQAVLLVGFAAHDRTALAAEVQRRGGVVAHTAGACDCAIVNGEEFAEKLRKQGIPILELEPAAVGGAA